MPAAWPAAKITVHLSFYEYSSGTGGRYSVRKSRAGWIWAPQTHSMEADQMDLQVLAR